MRGNTDSINSSPQRAPAASDWRSFEQAAAKHPEMLFVVSAGNNGRDIDTRPVYPAALKLANMITVTSAGADGRLARGSNWGARIWRIGGLVPNILRRYRATKSEGARRWYESNMAERPCHACSGYRLRPESLAVTFRGLGIHELGEMPIGQLFERVDPTPRTVGGT